MKEKLPEGERVLGKAGYLERSNDLGLKVIASPNLTILSPSLLPFCWSPLLESRGEGIPIEAIPPAQALRAEGRALKGGERIRKTNQELFNIFPYMHLLFPGAYQIKSQLSCNFTHECSSIHLYQVRTSKTKTKPQHPSYSTK